VISRDPKILQRRQIKPRYKPAVPCPRCRFLSGPVIETEAASIRYVAELVGADTESERAIRWLITLMVLCCDPFAIALTAAASARRSATA
jgi:hypothetical protein